MDEDLWLHITKDVKKIKHRFVPRNNHHIKRVVSFSASSLTRTKGSEIGDLVSYSSEIPGLRCPRQLARDDDGNIQARNSNFKPNPNLLFNLKIPIFHTLTPKKRVSIPDVDARIDLHGMTKLQAFEKLESFLKQACFNGKKHALIITGKGKLDNPGAIKLEVPRWLEHTELKKYLISYSIAKPNLGGEGAISVILKARS
jgi:hypothetical protein